MLVIIGNGMDNDFNELVRANLTLEDYVNKKLYFAVYNI